MIDVPATAPIGIWLKGQSNGSGGARIIDITDPGLRAQLAVAYPSVLMRQRIGQSDADPIVWNEYPLAPLAPRNDGGQDKFGLELTLGRAFDKVYPGRVRIGKYTGNGMGLHDHRRPSALYPTQPPGAPLFFDGMADAMLAFQRDTGAEIVLVVDVGGERESKFLAQANVYAEDLLEDLDAIEEVLGRRPLYAIPKLNPNQAGAHNAAVRAEEELFAQLEGQAVLVDCDGGTLRDDDHWDADTTAENGDLVAAATLPLLHTRVPRGAARKRGYGYFWDRDGSH